MAKSQTQSATDKSKDLYSQGKAATDPILQGLNADKKNAQDFQTATGSEAKAGFEQMGETGGYDPTQLSNLRNQFSNIQSTYDPSGTLKSGYTNFATTGGYNDQQKTDFLNQATSGVTSTYDILQQQAQRNAAATGGYGSGGDMSQLARQLSQKQADATLAARTGLDTMVNQNKLSGLGGLQTTGEQERNLAASTAGLEGDVAAGRRAGTQGLQGLYNTTTGEISDQGKQVLQTLGLQFNTQEEATQFLTQLSKNPGLFQTMFQDLISAGGAAAGAASGLGVRV